MLRAAGLALLLTLVAPALAHAQVPIVVGFEQSLSDASRGELLARAGVEHGRRIAYLRSSTARVPLSERAAILRRLRALPGVAFAERDRRVDLGRPRIGSRVRIARAPDDKGFDYQYGLYQANDDDIDATNAWDRRTSCSKVAVLDTGVDTNHPDLRSNVWHNKNEVKGNGVDDDRNGYVDDYYGVDLVRGKGSGVDHNGHGTHVAGIIAAGGNNDRGVAGVCWKAQLMSVRFMDADGRGTTSGAAEAITYAVRMGAHVLNASYASSLATDVERRAIEYARDHGALIVAAAGNDGRGDASYPAAYPDDNVIAVAATDDRDRLASFSNYDQSDVDLAAPGDGIVSTWDGADYREASGTSMAAPFVAASAAMLRAEASPSIGRMRSLLLKHVDKVSSLASKVASGGRLNIRRALEAG